MFKDIVLYYKWISLYIYNECVRLKIYRYTPCEIYLMQSLRILKQGREHFANHGQYVYFQRSQVHELKSLGMFCLLALIIV